MTMTLVSNCRGLRGIVKNTNINDGVNFHNSAGMYFNIPPLGLKYSKVNLKLN